MVIRNATYTDLDAMTAIYNQVLATSTAIYSEQPSTVEERRTWFNSRQAAGYPVLVSEDSGKVTGFASYGDFRP